MTKNCNRLRQLIFENVKKDDLWSATYKIAKTSVACYTNSIVLRDHIKSFFYCQPYSAKAFGRVDISLYFLTLDNKSIFLKKLIKDIDSLWEAIHKGTYLKRNFEIFQQKDNPHLLLFRVAYLIGIVDLNLCEGFYLMPEEASNDIGVDRGVFYFILSELFWTRKYLLIHASCVSDNNNNGILIAGPSGTGKTTFCLRLLEEGFNFLSNDLVLLRERRGHVQAFGIPEKRIKVREGPASLFSNMSLQGKGRDENGSGYVSVERFYTGDKGAGCKVKILGTGSTGYRGLIPTVNLLIPPIKEIIDRKLSLLGKLVATASHFHFFLPRDTYRLKKTLNKKIKEILALMQN